MKSLNVLLRRARTLLWTAFSILIISAAILVGVGKLLMPYSQRYQPSLEAWLSAEFGQTVTLQSFDGEWKAFGPRLSLQGLRLKPLEGDSSGVAIARAAVDLKPLNVFLPGKAWYNFLVIGADLQLVRNEQGQYALSGSGVGRSGENDGISGLRNLVGIGELILEDSSLAYEDSQRGIHMHLGAIDARLQLDGDTVSLAFEANLSDEATGQVYGEVEASGFLQLSENKGLQEAHWQVTVRELLLASLAGRLPANPFLPQEGRVNAEMWCDWTAQKPLQLAGVVDLRNGRLDMDGEETTVDHLNARLSWLFSDKRNWRLDLDDLLYDDGAHSWTAPSIALARNLKEDLGLWISADYLPLEAPLNLARNIMAIYGTQWPEFLPGSAAGTVSGLELVLDSQWRLKLAQGMARHASISDWGKWPDVQGLDGRIDLAQGSGNISLHANQLDVEWPQMFERPLQIALPECDVELQWGERWQVGIHNCRLMNDDVALGGDAVIAGNVGRPALDLNVEFTRGKIANFRPYWPQAILRESVVKWLRRGLVGGELESGRMQIHGDMDDWPFRRNEGRFEAVASIIDAELDYFPGWPRAQQVDASVRFEGSSMTVDGAIGNIGGVAVQHAVADIADFKAPLLGVRYEAGSTLKELVNFFVESPLESQFQTGLSRFGFAGPASTTGSLQLQLGAKGGALAVDGRVLLQGDHFTDPNSGVALQAIKGELQYSRTGISGSGITAQFKGKPAQIELSGGKESQEKFRADITGQFSVEDLVPDFLLQDVAELALAQGESDWQVSVVIPVAASGQKSAAELVVRSDLVGIEIDFPAPLHKMASESWPLELHYPLDDAPEKLLDLMLTGRMQLLLELSQSSQNGSASAQPVRGVLRLGNEPAGLPNSQMFRISGATDILDLDGWVDLATDGVKQGRGFAGLQMERGNLAIRQMRFLDRMFNDVSIGLDINQDEVKAVFSGADIDGHVVLNPGSGASGSLSAEFERLVMATPVSSGVDVESNPGELPALHLFAKSFQYAGIELGETRIEAYPTSTGFHFEKVESESDHLSVRASGDWSLADEGQRSDFKILVTSESLGKLMRSMDFGAPLEGGQTVLHFSAWWPGSPARFALSKLNGELDFSVSQGQISNAGTGTGRLLGLLSVQALPRRLALDFRDVFDSGFSFDEAKGSFQMENGAASTDDVVLSSSAAKISLTGRTDLVAQQYDQVMTIQPGLGNTLPMIGALAGGPGGAAAGLALQGLLQQQLGEASQVQYTITGSWEQPVIEPVLKNKKEG